MLVFKDILGHEQIKEHFKNAVETGKVSHAYILSGEAGMGRKSLANAFALSLLCEKGKPEPCMQCHACRQVLSASCEISSKPSEKSFEALRASSNPASRFLISFSVLIIAARA